MNTALVHQLRGSTKALHQQAERAGIMPALLQGSLPRGCFAQLQRNLHALYEVLEPTLQQQALAHPVLAAWALPALARGPALARDLHYLQGPDWSALPLVPATQTYVDRLQSLSVAQPLLLAAHAYVRYLGDLSGGQALGKVVRRSMALPGPDGARFFDFGTPQQVAELGVACREALAGLPPALADDLVHEACWSFKQHVLVFEQLARDLQSSSTRSGAA